MARRIRQDLFVNSADQSPYGANQGVDYPGGIGKFMVSATFGGGNVALQMLGPDGTTWLPIDQYAQASACTLSANGIMTFIAPAGRMRAVITTATAVYAAIIGCPENVAG